MNFPRVLILSSSVFNKVTGGGVLLTNLFQGWPREKIAAIHFDAVPPDDAVCGRFYRLTREEMRWVFPFSLFQRSSAGVGSNTASSLAEKPSLAKGFLKTVLGEGLPWETRVSPSLKKWVEDFRPETLYVMPGMPYMDLAVELAERYKRPLVIHMMDDWPSVYGKNGLLGPLLRRQAFAQLERLVKAASVRMAIGTAMARAYEQRYGVPFSVFYNGVDVASYRPQAKISWKTNGPFEILYVGSILPHAQLESLMDVCRVVNRMAANGAEIRLSIHSPYGPAYRTSLEIGPAVRVSGPVNDTDFFPLLTKADLLLLPVNFDATSRLFVRYSFPAKLPAYMLSGTPMLVYGPPDVGYVNEVVENGGGHGVAQRSDQQLEEGIRTLMNDEALRERLGKTAQETALKRHDLSRLRDAFQQALSTAR